MTGDRQAEADIDEKEHVSSVSVASVKFSGQKSVGRDAKPPTIQPTPSLLRSKQMLPLQAARVSQDNSRQHKQPYKAMAATHYDVLGVGPDASLEEIKAAHRRLSLLLHPDKQQQKKSSIETNKSACTEQVATKTSSLHDIDDDDEEDVTDVGESAQNDINEQLNNLALEESQAQSRSSATDEAKSEDGSNGVDKKDEQETDQSSGTPMKYTFRQIHTAWETLRDPTKRAAYDEDLALKSKRKASKVDKAVTVKLSEMEEILLEEEGEHDNGTGDRDHDEYYNHDVDDFDDENCQVAYCYQCRCGDEIEVLQEELVEKNDEKYSDDSNVFECPSCCLCIRVEVDMELDEL